MYQLNPFLTVYLWLAIFFVFCGMVMLIAGGLHLIIWNGLCQRQSTLATEFIKYGLLAIIIPATTILFTVFIPWNLNS